MPVDVKSYLASMKSISSQTSSNIKSGTTNQNDLKIQALLAQLIEALSYAKSMDFRQKTLNAPAVGSEDKTAREILNQMKAQEKLVKQLAEGQALSKEQGDTLTKAIDKFYEMAGATEINYKKFAENLDKFAKQDLPEAVKTRIANDSKDAHIIGKQQLNEENPVINTLKKIKYYIEDTMENTKQFRKKLFVNLDQFKETLSDAFDKLGKDIADGSIIKNLLKGLSSLGAIGFFLQGFLKDGLFGIPTLVKQFKNLQVLAKGGKLSETLADMFKGIKYIFKQFKFLPKLIEKFGLGKGLGIATQGLGKGLIKGAGKNVLKKIPVLGTLLSVWFAWERWKKKDYAGAFIEIASGISAIFPGIGTLVSIGLDLINFGRDSSFFKNMKEKAEAKIPNLSENILMSMPIIGQIFGLQKTFALWKSGDKLGALKMATKSLMTIMPGGAWIFDLLNTVFSTQWGDTPASATAESGSASNFNNSMNEQGDAETNFGPRLASTASLNAKPHSIKKCGLYVGNAVEKVLGKNVASALRGHGKDWAVKLQGPVGKKYFDFIGRTNKQDKLPAGSIVSWPAVPGHPFGHVEISDGKGHLISDFSRDASRYPASGYVGSKPFTFVPKGIDSSLIAKTADQQIKGTSDNVLDDGSESAIASEVDTNVQTYDDVMSAYTDYMNKVQSQINETEGAQTVSSKAWAERAPMLSTSQTAQQTVITTPSIQSQPSSMTTDVNDTAIAILNSVLFK